MAIDAETGAPIWAKRYDAPGEQWWNDVPESITVSPNGNIVVVTGTILKGFGTSDIVTVAYRAPTGERLWARRYLGPGNSHGAPAEVAFSPDGRTVFLAGSGDGTTRGGEILTIAYRAGSGTTRWSARHDGIPYTREGGVALAVSPNGSKVFVSGNSTRVSTGIDQMVVAYRADKGRKLWSVRHDRGVGDDDVVTDMAIAPNGRTIFVTGTTRRTQTSYDYYTVAYGTGLGTCVGPSATTALQRIPTLSSMRLHRSR